MIYTSYDYYKNDFGGVNLPESDFSAAATQASRYLDVLTGGRARQCSCSEAVQNACCAAAELVYQYDKAVSESEKTGNKASETVGSYSVTYRSADVGAGLSLKENQSVSLYNAVRFYLSGTGLLYRGLCR